MADVVAPDQTCAVIHWSIEGVILADTLPFDAFGGIGECAVGPIPQAELNSYHQPDVFVLEPPHSTTDCPWVATSNQVRFYASHRVLTSVEADDRDTALALGEVRFRRCAVALAMSSSPIRHPSCSVRITKWARLDPETGQEVEAGETSTHARGIRQIEIATFGVMARAIDLANQARDDEHLGRLFDTWYRAEQIYPNADRQDERRWTLIEYARLLEDIGQLVAEAPEQEDYKQLVAAIRASLKARLDSDVDGREILKAADKVRQARRSATKSRIKDAGEKLEVGEDANKRAQTTWEIRNTKAGHADPRVITGEEIYVARAAAATYLFGYIKKIGPNPDQPPVDTTGK